MVLLVDRSELLVEGGLAYACLSRILYLISNESDPFGCVAFARPPIERQLGLCVPERLQRLLAILALGQRLELVVGEMVCLKRRPFKLLHLEVGNVLAHGLAFTFEISCSIIYEADVWWRDIFFVIL